MKGGIKDRYRRYRRQPLAKEANAQRIDRVMQRRQLRQAFDLPQGVVADQRGVFEAFAAVGDAVANAVYLLQAAQDPAAGAPPAAGSLPHGDRRWAASPAISVPTFSA